MQRLAGALAVTIVLGLASRAFPIDLTIWDKVVGDSLYAVAVYLVLAMLSMLLHHALRPVVTGAVALAICVAIEALQATGYVAEHVRSATIRFVFGTTFELADLAWYALGVLAITLIDRQWLRPATSIPAENPPHG